MAETPVRCCFSSQDCRPGPTSTAPTAYSKPRHHRRPTVCPYRKSRTDWAIRIGDAVYPGVAWTYDYPLREVTPIAGMIPFSDEKLDIFVDDTRLARPLHPFNSSDGQNPQANALAQSATFGMIGMLAIGWCRADTETMETASERAFHPQHDCPWRGSREDGSVPSRGWTGFIPPFGSGAAPIIGGSPGHQ